MQLKAPGIHRFQPQANLVQIPPLCNAGTEDEEHYVTDEGEPIKANFVEIDTTRSSGEWILDSGASAHVSGDNAVFRDITTGNHFDFVPTVNGSKLPLAGHGNISVDHNEGVSKVLYVQGVATQPFVDRL